jgi:hypothetical protein
MTHCLFVCLPETCQLVGLYTVNFGGKLAIMIMIRIFEEMVVTYRKFCFCIRLDKTRKIRKKPSVIPKQSTKMYC